MPQLHNFMEPIVTDAPISKVRDCFDAYMRFYNNPKFKIRAPICFVPNT